MSNARNLSKLIPSSTGLVQTANIADDAITNAKIGAGAIGNTEVDASAAIAQSKLAAIASSNLPAGSVIQVKGDNYNAAVNIETVSTTPIGTNLEVSITFASTSNKFLAMLHVPDFYNYNVDTRHLDIGFQYSTDSFSSHSAVLGTQQVISDHLGYENFSGSVLLNATVHHFGSCPTTSAIKIRPYLQAGNGSMQINANTQGVIDLVVMEIQG